MPAARANGGEGLRPAPASSITSRASTTAAPQPARSGSTSGGNGDSGSGGSSSTAAGVAKATGLTIGLVMLSRVLGVVRDIIFNHLFGQNDITSVYRAAFNVPDLIALVIAGGALSSVFIPVFADYWNSDRKDDAWRIFGTIVGIVSAVVAVLVVGMEIGVVPLTAMLHPKFTAEQVRETARLSAILLPGQWCLVVGGFLMGSLYARKRFLVPALGPVIYNLGTIIAGLTQWPLHHPDTTALVWGTVIGAFIGNIVLPVMELLRIGVRVRTGFDLRHPGVRMVGQLMLPVLLGLSLGQLTMFITQCVLPADDRISALTNAYNLTQAPIGVFAQAFGIVLLPTISAYAATQDWPSFRRTVIAGIRQVLFLTLPTSFLMAALALPIVRVLYVGRAFTEDNARLAAHALLCYSLGTFAWSAQAILFRGFVARKDIWTPIAITTPMVAVFYLLAKLAVYLQPNGITLMALTPSFLGTVAMFGLLFALKKKMPRLKIDTIFFATIRIGAASLIAAAPAWFVADWFDRTFEPDKMTSLLTLAVAGGLGIGIYLAIAILMKFKELGTIRDMIRRRRAPAVSAAASTDGGGPSAV